MSPLTSLCPPSLPRTSPRHLSHRRLLFYKGYRQVWAKLFNWFFCSLCQKKRKYSDIRWWSPLQSFKEIVVEQWLRLLIWRICTVKNKVLRNDFKCMWVICKSWFVFLFQHLWNCFSWTFLDNIWTGTEQKHMEALFYISNLYDNFST